MAISRQEATYRTGGGAGSTTFTLSAYDPGYAAGTKARIVLVGYKTAAAGAGAIGSLTYGGIPMRTAAAQFVNNGVFSFGWSYIINPPTGAQDIVFTTVGATTWSMVYMTVAYHSTTRYSFRVGDADVEVTQNDTEASVGVSHQHALSQKFVAFSVAAVNQTLDFGDFLVGDAHPGQFVSREGSIGTDGFSLTDDINGILVHTSTSTTFYQSIASFMEINTGLFPFFAGL